MGLLGEAEFHWQQDSRRLFLLEVSPHTANSFRFKMRSRAFPVTQGFKVRPEYCAPMKSQKPGRIPVADRF